MRNRITSPDPAAARRRAVNWDAASANLETARRTVWGHEPYEETTEACLRLLDRFRPPGAARMLDVGCGIGRLTIPMAARAPAAHVWGLDVSEGLLALARTAAEAHRVQNVTWVWGDTAKDLELIDFAWSVVVLQHNPPEVCAPLVASVAEALAPGGVFAYQVIENIDFTDWGHLPVEVADGWAQEAGLEVVDRVRGVLEPDWLWIVARRP